MSITPSVAEILEKQLEKEAIAYQALDNGILSCADAQRLQALVVAAISPATYPRQRDRRTGDRIRLR
jgi:hypothetical protein